MGDLILAMNRLETKHPILAALLWRLHFVVTYWPWRVWFEFRLWFWGRR